MTNLNLHHLLSNQRRYSLLVGVSIGVVGGLLAILVVTLGPVITLGLILGLTVGLYILTDLYGAFYAVIFVLMLIPFGTLPFDLGFTPTLLDSSIGGFLLVYLVQWMTGKRYGLQLTPVHILVFIYFIWLLLSFALGLRYAPFTVTIIRQFTQTLLSIGLVFILVDVLRDVKALRRLVLVILIGIGTQALITLGLYVLPDTIAENILNRFGRIGYPVGGVIRYIEANPEFPERAIGTWIDPNSLGGVLAIAAVVIAPQAFAENPVLRYRWLTLLVLGLVVLSLILSFSRASMLAMAIGFAIIAFVRYRRFIPFLMIGALLLLFLPQTQGYIERFIDAFTAADLATQMRLGEYSDSFRLIQRYPIFGVGFTGTPDIDIYTDVASMYLIMANQIGLVGVGIYLTTIFGVFSYGIYAWQYARKNTALDAIHLGYHAALLTALTNAVADLYFFRIDFQAPITLFWLTVALCLASSRLAIEKANSSDHTESGVVKNKHLH